MLVLIANNSGAGARKLLEKFPDRIGHIYSPGGYRGPWPINAIDNGRFPIWQKGGEWDADAFRRHVARAAASIHLPRWIAVPDVVADRTATLESWTTWAPELSACGLPLAFVAQDGMTAADVPSSAAVVFVGGTTDWKQSTAAYWCEHFPRVHIGRVNGERDLWRYHRAGAESCDGSGWFRGDRRQLDGLWYYLADSSGHESDAVGGPLQPRLWGGT